MHRCPASRSAAAVRAATRSLAFQQSRGSLALAAAPRSASTLCSSSSSRVLTALRLTRVSGAATALQSHRSFMAGTPVARKDVPFLLADIGEGITECEVIQWFVKEGDHVEQFSPICEVQSDKAAVEITSRYDGVIKKLHYGTGDVARVGSPLVDITTSEAGEENASPIAEKAAAVVDSVKAAAAPAVEAVTAAFSSISKEMEAAYTLATPAVRRVARENKVDLAKISGSGPSRRILKGDVLAYVSGTATSAPAVAPTSKLQTATKSKTSAPTTPTGPVEGDRTVPLGAIQKAMFKAMTRSLQIPHFGFSEEIVLDATSAQRAAINRQLKHAPVHGLKKISYMPIFIKALSMALNDFPILNARLLNTEDASKAQLQYRGSHNIGVAMDTPQGLIVPNVKNVNSKSILEIAAELERLKVAGSSNSLAAADLADGTITLSNVGNIGGTLLHPVLVSSEVCIGAIGRIQRLPRFETVVDPETGNKKEVVVAKEILNVSFNADHRVIDGATVARFVSVWKNYLEHPATMSANLR
ncbi:hypothetical protein HDU87_007824 [Geranomyces variabilis]|uniref:Dihydrolipoamide acetyltransferase component of pyruvate dehydrogenase complex n=1 Tax=Geranomyces variabilis TaxID=109894 RepID=A0AAD5TJ25_9FUNG|nr:hypothetical protein HDU87_007824 [Geranomyces variabilis]